MGIKPIETVYNGYRFRSRLEARWAVFFDALGVEYEYEPEGFEIGNGVRYLPDFKVKCWGDRGCLLTEPFDLYIEVKGRMTQEDADKIKSFVWACPKCEEPVLIGADECDDFYPVAVCSCGEKIKCDKHNYYICPHTNRPVGSLNNSVLIVGGIPNSRQLNYSHYHDAYKPYECMDGVDIYAWNYQTIDGDYFGAYPAVTKDGKFYLDGDDCNYLTMDENIIRRAFDKARQARFEHGECG